MNILVLTSEFPNNAMPNRASFNRQHLNALSCHHKLRVVCPVPWLEFLRSHDRKSDFRAPSLVSEEIEVTYKPYWYPPGVLRGFHDDCMWFSLKRYLRSLADQFKPDMVLGIWAFPDGAVALRLARLLEVPVAVQVLGSDVNLLDSFPTKRTKTISTLRAVDRVLTVSSALRDILLLKAVPPENVAVVYRGVNSEMFFPRDQSSSRRSLCLDPQKKHFLFIGNLVPVKDPRLLLMAFAAADFGDRAELHIVGEGPLRRQLEATCEAEGITSSVRFHGILKHGDIPQWMSGVDALVLSSVAEGVPNVLLEARAIGLPYIATRVGGVAEISNHEGARLVDQGSVKQMRDALIATLGESSPVRRSVSWPTWEDAGVKLSEQLIRVRDQSDQAY